LLYTLKVEITRFSLFCFSSDLHDLKNKKFHKYYLVVPVSFVACDIFGLSGVIVNKKSHYSNLTGTQSTFLLQQQKTQRSKHPCKR
jgi:hypothetical protein